MTQSISNSKPVQNQYIYYRSLGCPAFPTLSPDDVEVSASEQVLGPANDQWKRTYSDDRLPEDLGLCEHLGACVFLVDALNIYKAILDSGLSSITAKDGDWVSSRYGELDIDDLDDYVAFLNALARISASDACEQATLFAKTAPVERKSEMEELARSFCGQVADISKE